MTKLTAPTGYIYINIKDKTIYGYNLRLLDSENSSDYILYEEEAGIELVAQTLQEQEEKQRSISM